jgi:hypothetical protein
MVCIEGITQCLGSPAVQQLRASAAQQLKASAACHEATKSQPSRQAAPSSLKYVNPTPVRAPPTPAPHPTGTPAPL